jgi:hypothetical protein
MFSGWQNSSNKYQYLIQSDWDNCAMNNTYKLSKDSFSADGVEYSSEPSFTNIDGITIWSALGNGNAICIYASGNYARTSNYSNTNYLGKISTISSLQSNYNSNTKQSDVFVVGCTSTTGGCCAGATKNYPAAILCNSYAVPQSLNVNLKAFYNFDSDINDSTINGLNLSKGGSCAYTITNSSKVGSSAIQFTNYGPCGSAAGLVYPSNIWNIFDGVTNASFSFWFNLTQNIPNTNPSASYCGMNIFGSDFGNFGFFVGPKGTTAYQFGGDNNIRIGIANNPNLLMSTSNPLTINTWYHFVGVLDNTNKNFTSYINGIKLNSLSFSSINAPGQNYQGFAIDGSGYGTKGEYGIPCIFDATGLWNKALTPDEVALLYHQASGRQYPFEIY